MEKIKSLSFKNYIAYNFGEKFENLMVEVFYSEVYLFIYKFKYFKNRDYRN